METSMNHFSGGRIGVLLRMCGLAGLVFLLHGCSGSESTVRINRRGGVSLEPSMVLCVGNIYGNQWKEFRKDLRKALKGHDDFKRLNGEPQEENTPDSAYKAIVATLAEQKQDLVIITGTFDLNKNATNKEETGPNNTKREYTEKNVTGTFSFRITNLTSHKLMLSRGISRSTRWTEAGKTSWLLETLVNAVISDPHEEEIRKQVISEFINELYPHEEFFDVKFLTDSDMPELETGISYANIAQWDKAIELFKSVIEKYPDNKNLHKVYYDLGIAYKWNNKFADARENLKKAYLMKNNSDYLDEIESLSLFEQEYKTREEQDTKPHE